MTTFNITNSKVEQINDQGDNFKITGNNSPVVAGSKQVAIASGNESVARIAQPKSSILKKLSGLIKAIWKWLTGAGK